MVRVVHGLCQLLVAGLRVRGLDGAVEVDLIEVAPDDLFGAAEDHFDRGRSLPAWAGRLPKAVRGLLSPRRVVNLLRCPTEHLPEWTEPITSDRYSETPR